MDMHGGGTMAGQAMNYQAKAYNQPMATMKPDAPSRNVWSALDDQEQVVASLQKQIDELRVRLEPVMAMPRVDGIGTGLPTPPVGLIGRIEQTSQSLRIANSFVRDLLDRLEL